MYDFPEYGEMLGAYYFNSIATPLLGNDVPVNQRRVGVLQVEDTRHPATRMLGQSWPIAEEFYTFATAPWNEQSPEANLSSPGDFRAPMGFSRDRVHVLLSLDTDRTNIEGVCTARERQEGRRLPAVVVAELGQGPRLLHVARTPARDVDQRLGVPRAPHRWHSMGARAGELIRFGRPPLAALFVFALQLTESRPPISGRDIRRR